MWGPRGEQQGQLSLPLLYFDSAASHTSRYFRYFLYSEPLVETMTRDRDDSQPTLKIEPELKVVIKSNPPTSKLLHKPMAIFQPSTVVAKTK